MYSYKIEEEMAVNWETMTWLGSGTRYAEEAEYPVQEQKCWNQATWV